MADGNVQFRISAEGAGLAPITGMADRLVEDLLNKSALAVKAQESDFVVTICGVQYLAFAKPEGGHRLERVV